MKRVFYFLVLWVLSACTTPGPLKNKNNIDSNKLFARIWANQELRLTQVQSFRAKIQLSLTEKGRSLSGSGFLISTPLGLRLELRDPLGRLQYSVGVTETDKFVAYYPSQSIAYFDSSAGKKYLKSFLKLDIGFLTLKDIWLGILPFKKTDANLVSVVPAETEGLSDVTIESSQGIWKASVDPETGDVIKLKRQSSEFKPEFEFSEFARCCESLITQNELPRIGRGVYLKNNQESEIELEWSEIVSIAEKKSDIFKMELPASVKRVRFK
jgi:outer membrane biogenesis lipoprotein LolB